MYARSQGIGKKFLCGNFKCFEKFFFEICDQNLRKVCIASALALLPNRWGSGARLRAPGGVQGRSPGGGPGGSAPKSSWILGCFKVRNHHSETLIIALNSY